MEENVEAEQLTDNVCVAHMSVPDMDCEYCQAEIGELQTIYNSIVKRNQQNSNLLMSQGAQLDPTSLVAGRLDMVLDVIFGQNPRERAKFEIAFAKSVLKSLDEALSAHARQRLTQGVPPGGGFLRG